MIAQKSLTDSASSSSSTGIVRFFLFSCGLVLLFLMAAFPMVLALLYIKAALFIVLIVGVVSEILIKGRIAIDPALLLWTIALSGIGVFATLVGVAREAPGAIKQMDVFVLWPLVYTALISSIKPKDIKYIIATLYATAIFLSVYGIILLAINVGWLSKLPMIETTVKTIGMYDRQGVGIYGGFTAITFTGLNSMPFLAPFAIAVAVINMAKTLPGNKLKSIGNFIVLVLVLVLTIISGRRALMLVVGLTPAMIFFFSCFLQKKERNHLLSLFIKVFFGGLLFVSVFIILTKSTAGISFENVWEMFAKGFDFSAETGGSQIRAVQFFALMEGFSEHPFIGNGLGAYVKEIIRNDARPWQYELFYVLMLFHVGIFGFLFYTFAIIWIYVEGIKIIRKNKKQGEIMIALMCGLSGVLIAALSNPYLARFDGLWFFFTPLILINLHRRAREHYGIGAYLTR